MNREIKFRAWDGKRKIDLQAITPLATDVPGLFIPKQEGVIIEQFTGLKDKNGVDCYEGDKLEHETYGRGVVEYDAENASFFVWFGDSKDNDDWSFLARVIKESKIIGHIHEPTKD